MSLRISEPLPSVPSTNYIHCGRGGLGNYNRVSASAGATARAPIEETRAESVSSTKSNSSTIYSCGRGGAGNIYSGSERMMFRFDEQLTRDRAREDVAPIFHVGRGGAGNFARKTPGDDGASRYSNESTRSVASGIGQMFRKISDTFSRSS